MYNILMTGKSIWIMGFAAIFVLSVTAISSAFNDASGESSEKPKAPRYSETCSHGHNGFDCKTPKYKIDISDLQERTDDLEKRVAQLEISR